MDYLIVEADTPRKMVSQVAPLLSEGWRPLGGLSVITGFDESEGEQMRLYTQSLVRGQDDTQ